MRLTHISLPEPVISYPALVGKLLAQRREAKGAKQGELARALGLSQSAYSRLEAGESILNLSQLRSACVQLGVAPHELLQQASEWETQLQGQGVQVVAEKPSSPAALAVGLGLLAALLIASR